MTLFRSRFTAVGAEAVVGAGGGGGGGDEEEAAAAVVVVVVAEDELFLEGGVLKCGVLFQIGVILLVMFGVRP